MVYSVFWKIKNREVELYWRVSGGMNIGELEYLYGRKIYSFKNEWSILGLTLFISLYLNIIIILFLCIINYTKYTIV